MKKLDFVIAGAQKSGTSTLDALFRRHPQIAMAKVKETHFFDDESRDWSAPDYAPLDAFFDSRTGVLRGEATPATVYWRPAIPRLYAYNPDIKVVLILRNPVTRAFAGWRKEYAAGREALSFAEAIRQFPDRVRAAAEVDGLHRYFSYVERGFYGAQLNHLLGYFPRRAVRCEVYEDFFLDQCAGLARLSRFLNVDPFAEPPAGLRLHAAREMSYPSVLADGDCEFLYDLYRTDIDLLERILNRSLAGWQHQAHDIGKLPRAGKQ